MDIAFTEDHVLLTLDLYFKSVFGVEQDVVPHLDRPHMGTDGDSSCPTEPARYLGSCRNEDSRPGAALTFGLADLHQDPVGQNGDGKLVAAGVCSLCGCLGGLGCHVRRLPQPCRAPNPSPARAGPPFPPDMGDQSGRTYRYTSRGQMPLGVSDGELTEMEDRGGQYRIGGAVDRTLHQVVQFTHST